MPLLGPSTTTRTIRTYTYAICRIDPETGRTINKRNPAQVLSAFARAYEKRTGIVVPRREALPELEEQLRRQRQRRRGPGRPRRPRLERKLWATGRRNGVPDHETKRLIKRRRVERQAALRDTQDQRAVERVIARTWPALPSGVLQLAAHRLAREGEQDDVTRLGAAACALLARRRPIRTDVSSLSGGTLFLIRRRIETTLRTCGRAVTAAASRAARRWPPPAPLRRPAR